jgi:hypothetical protein
VSTLPEAAASLQASKQDPEVDERVLIPRTLAPEVLEAMREAYHRSRPRWDDQERCSKHTGLEAAYRVLVEWYTP